MVDKNNLKITEFHLYLLNAFDFTHEEIKIIIKYFDKIELKAGDFFLKQEQYCKKIGFVSQGAFIYFENTEAEKKVCDFAFEKRLGLTIQKFD